MQRMMFRGRVCFGGVFCLILTLTVIITNVSYSPKQKIQSSGVPMDIIGRSQQAGPDVWNTVFKSEYSRQSPDTDTDTDVRLAIDDALAVEVSRRVRLACFVTTREKYMDTKLKAVNETWARRCDVMLYVMTSNWTYPDILALTIPDTHGTLTEKIRTAFTHMRTHFLDRFDWFLKADDDTFVIVENLKFLLSHFDPQEAVVLGDHFKPFSPSGYMGGGAGYVLSREALRLLVDEGYKVPGRCRLKGGSEDIETGRCLDKVGVTKYLSLDKYNRSTFHANTPKSFIANISNFVESYRVNKYKQGIECCSQLAISFHYIQPEMILVLEYLLYRVSVFGRTLQYQKLVDMFRVEETKIPRDLKRRPYPNETVEEYYDNLAEWRRKNMTIYTGKKKN